jgi:hypothetical protein
MNSTETVTYLIYCDIELQTYDINVRLYWTGEAWSTESEDSKDFKQIDDVLLEEIQDMQKQYPEAPATILKIKSTTTIEDIGIERYTNE